MLCRADSIGVFQVESRAQISTLPRLKPRKFYDLVVEIALIRPGPVQGGAVHPYIRRRAGTEKITYLHPLLEPVLKRTLGVPLFQEQLMQMAVAVGGCTAEDADLLRRAMGSKRGREKIESLEAKLYAGMAANGISKDDADAIYAKIQAFANFGFAESHSLSFAVLVYASSWLKLHYPGAFLASLLRHNPWASTPRKPSWRMPAGTGSRCCARMYCIPLPRRPSKCSTRRQVPKQAKWAAWIPA
ncbi:error-prone DNA polymerase [Arthrobacter sp. Hiyo8]|nr:error-prone DNA polymerase [Arthrobacter sp. Hiyo8]